MRVVKNILIMIGLLVGAWVISIAIVTVNPPSQGKDGIEDVAYGVAWLVIIASSLWASISSSRLEFRKYKSGMSNHPVTIFIVHLLFWVIAFPWFLTVRDKIKDGTAELKDEFKPAISSPQVTPRPISGSQVTPVTRETPSPVVQDLVPPPMPAVKPRQTSPVSAPLPTPPPMPIRSVQPEPDRLVQLQKLADFKVQGILSEEEFQAEKRRLMG